MNMLTSNYHDCHGTAADFASSLCPTLPRSLLPPNRSFLCPFTGAITTLITAFCSPVLLSTTDAVNRNFVASESTYPPRVKLLAGLQVVFRGLDLSAGPVARDGRIIQNGELIRDVLRVFSCFNSILINGNFLAVLIYPRTSPVGESVTNDAKTAPQ